MRVENQVGGARRRRGIVLVGRSIRSHLHQMLVAVVAVDVCMDFSGRQARRTHRHQQQQAGQLPKGALEPEAHATLESSTRHSSRMPEKREPLKRGNDPNIGAQQASVRSGENGQRDCAVRAER